ncbi:hypothetical protein D3C72_1527780 [compost metagenome]
MVANTVPTMDVISPPGDFILWIIGVMSLSRTPAFSTTPPKARAVTISHTVSIMLDMPPRDRSWSSSG